ncbi:unnamed protein product [Heterobilharzia americana]|nr:unnamed protein product [Heterobilharzia americana]
MVQAAIAHANAAAALCSPNPSSVCGTVCSPSTLALSPQHSTQVSFCHTSTSNSSSSNSGAGSSPATVSALSQSANPHIRNNTTNYFSSHQPNQSNVTSFVAQLQQHQQQQTLAAVHLNQHVNANNTPNSTLGFANVVSATAGLPPQMAAAAIGLLGGYNSFIKELTGSEGHFQTGLPPYQQNINF